MFNINILTEFFESKIPEGDANLVVLSDHGVVRSLWESEFLNHGEPTGGNESFFFIFDKTLNEATQLDVVSKEELFNQNEREELTFEPLPKGFHGIYENVNSLYETSPNILKNITRLEAFQVAPTLASVFQNVNAPINSLSEGVSLAPNLNTTELKRLRASEAQVYSYLRSFPDFTTKKQGEIFLSSPFHRISKKILKKIGKSDSLSQNDLSKKINLLDLKNDISDYQNFVKNLRPYIEDRIKDKQEIENKVKSDTLLVIGICYIGFGLLFIFYFTIRDNQAKLKLYFVLTLHLLAPGFYSIQSYELNEEIFIFGLLGVSVSLLVCITLAYLKSKFSKNESSAESSQKSDQNSIQFGQNKKDDLSEIGESGFSNSNNSELFRLMLVTSGFLVLDILLFSFNYVVSLNNFAFVYFKNPLIQTISVIVYLFYIFQIFPMFHEFNTFAKKRNQKLKNLRRFLIMKYLYIVSYLVMSASAIFYEVILSIQPTNAQTSLMMYVSRAFYLSFGLAFVVALLIPVVGAKLLFMVLVSGMFWMGSNYIRLAFLVLVLPFLYWFKKKMFEIRDVKLRCFASISLIVIQAILIFKILR